MIPAFDYLRDFERHRDEYLAACERVFTSGRLILGPETAAFEQEFAAYVGSDYAVAVNSGTDALSLALVAAGIRRGDEVLVPALTAPATAVAVCQAGAMPRFVDVRNDTLTIDAELAEAAIGPRTRAVVPVHLYGHPACDDGLIELARRRGLVIIEDCAQAHGAAAAGRHVGTQGRIGCFSFYPTKNLGAFGDAGICVTDDLNVARRLRRLRHYGLDPDGTAVDAGGRNSRMDELQAALLRARLTRLDEAVARKVRLAEQYRRGLADIDVALPAECPGHAWHQFVIRSPRRRELCELLTRHGVGWGIHYPRPLHRMPAFGLRSPVDRELPTAERASREVLSLPMFAELELSEVELICSLLVEHFPAPSRSVSWTTQ